MSGIVFNLSKSEFLSRIGVQGYYASALYVGRGVTRTISAEGRLPFILGKKILDAMPDDSIGHEKRYLTPELCSPERATTTRRVDDIELIINVPLTTNEIREVMHGYSVAQKRFSRSEAKKR